jgi:nucleoside-diphosphate-sugar epimerase
MMPTTICAVTGANGYVGSVIVRHLRNAGFAVLQLRRLHSGQASELRSEPGEPLVKHYALQDEVSPELLHDVNILIHCAYDFSVLHWPEIERTNVYTTLRLFEAARQAGVKRTIFISSVSAFEGCKSHYGKAKLAIEQLASRHGVIIVRPGLVYGCGAGGMVGALHGLLALPWPLLPMIGLGKQAMLLVHEDDLGELLVKLCRQPHVPIGRPIIAAGEQVYYFRDIMRMLAQRRSKKVLFVPIPWRLIWSILKCAELLGLRLRLRSDSLVSLMNQNPSPDFSATREIGIHFRNVL